MKKICCIIFSAMFLFASIVHAEIKTYTGEGEYIMSEFETLDVAKQRAKQKAERNAQELAGVFVSSYTKVKNLQVQEDEIIAITSGILKVLDVQYKLTPLDDGKSVLIFAKIKASIDSDEINKWLEKGVEQRSELSRQNEELRKAIAEQDKKIAELQKQVANVKTQQDREKITQEFAEEDKIFLSNQKYEEARKWFVGYYDVYIDNSGRVRITHLNSREEECNNAKNLCTIAINLNPNNIQAYILRADVYKNWGDFPHDTKYCTYAIMDYTKAIQLSPNNEEIYYKRGNAYSMLNDYSRAISDYKMAIKLNPNHVEAYDSLGYIYLYRLKEYNMAIYYCNKVIQILPDDKNNERYHILREAYLFRSFCYNALGEKEKAQSDRAKYKSMDTWDYEKAKRNWS